MILFSFFKYVGVTIIVIHCVTPWILPKGIQQKQRNSKEAGYIASSQVSMVSDQQSKLLKFEDGQGMN